MAVFDSQNKLMYPYQHHFKQNDRQLASIFYNTLVQIQLSTSKIGDIVYTDKQTTSNNVVTVVVRNSQGKSRTITATYSQINKLFVDGYSASDSVKNQALIDGFKRALVTNCNYRQLVNQLTTVKTNGIPTIELLTIGQINELIAKANAIVKMLHITRQQYTFDDRVNQMLSIDYPIVLVNKHYLNARDGFVKDKRLVNDKRYQARSRSVISNVIINYRLIERDIIVIDYNKASTISIVDQSNNQRIRNIANKHNLQIQQYYWNDTLTSCKIVLNNSLSITINGEYAVLQHKGKRYQRRVDSFNQQLLTKQSTRLQTWADDTSNVVKFFNSLPARSYRNTTLTSSAEFETVYQELSPVDQQSATNLFYTINDLLYSFTTDTIDVFIDYWIHETSSNFRHIIVNG